MSNDKLSWQNPINVGQPVKIRILKILIDLLFHDILLTSLNIIKLTSSFMINPVLYPKLYVSA